MENQVQLGSTMIYSCSSSNEVETTTKNRNRNEFSEETQKALLSILDDFLHDMSLEVSKLTLYHLVNCKNTITKELFSNNLEELIHLSVLQSAATSYNSGLNNIINKFCEVLIKTQDGLIIHDSEPYNLKFKLKNGEEYWMDILSSDEQKSNDMQTLKKHQEKADKEGKIYRLCIYDDELPSKDEHILNGYDFWKLLAGFDQAKLRIFSLIKGAANEFSISSIVRETKNQYHREWSMQS